MLINEYHRPDGEKLFHLDAYRLLNATEGAELDIDDMLMRGPLVVEWPENIHDALPDHTLKIALRWMAEEHRGLVLTACGNEYRDLLSGIRQQVYGGY